MQITTKQNYIILFHAYREQERGISFCYHATISLIFVALVNDAAFDHHVFIYVSALVSRFEPDNGCMILQSKMP